MKLRVWVLDHDWGDDHSVCLFPSEQAAREAIQGYVHEQWNEGMMDDEEYPGDPQVAVEIYFDRFDEECFHIHQQTVIFPEIPDLPNEEVVLNPDECAAMVTLLDYAHGLVGDVGGELAKPDEEVQELFNSVYEKLKD